MVSASTVWRLRYASETTLSKPSASMSALSRFTADTVAQRRSGRSCGRPGIDRCRWCGDISEMGACSREQPLESWGCNGPLFPVRLILAMRSSPDGESRRPRDGCRNSLGRAARGNSCTDPVGGRLLTFRQPEAGVNIKRRQCGAVAYSGTSISGPIGIHFTISGYRPARVAASFIAARSVADSPENSVLLGRVASKTNHSHFGAA